MTFNTSITATHSGVVNTERTFPVVLYTEIREGVVQETITAMEKGWIKFSGSYWSATFYNTPQASAIAAGERVKVLGRQGNTLLVVPTEQTEVVPLMSRKGPASLQAA